MLQQTLGPPQGLRPRQRPAQVVHQPVETGVVRRLLEVFRTLVQPGAQDGGQGTVETAGGKKNYYLSNIVHVELIKTNVCKCASLSDSSVGLRALTSARVLLVFFHTSVPVRESRRARSKTAAPASGFLRTAGLQPYLSSSSCSTVCVVVKALYVDRKMEV